MKISPIGTESGFTLLELILVLGFIGLAVGLVIPNWQGRRQEVSLRLASRQLAQLCRYGLTLADTSEEELRLRLQEDGFVLENQSQEVLDSYSLPEALSYSGPEELAFLPGGKLEEEAVLLLSLAEEQYAVKITPEGAVEVYPGGDGSG
ncbi:MAG: type II secretion system protein [Firmicutes bacterium]|jgi:type II secretory pathway pseudopilin PulG|nr:type II secretion system protein [Bacillota bacterium]HQD39432.1 type II secretion system protein [Bacillota bacterium]